MDTIDNQSQEKRYLRQKQTMEKTVNLFIGIWGDDINSDAIQDWFRQMTFFSPNKMAYVALPKNSRKKYREDIFFKELEKSINHKDHCITYIEINEDDWYLRNYMDYCDTCILETSIKLDVWNEKKEEIIDKYERLFIRLGGCFGFATNSFDCLCIQNPNDVHVYERYNIDATGLPLIPNEMPGMWVDRFDVSSLPGHYVHYGEIIFTTAEYMWFGPDFDHFLSKKTIEEFKDCDENVNLGAGFRRVCLWPSLEDYDNPIFRKRQNKIRSDLKMDETICNMSYYRKDQALPNSDVHFEIGEFEHGGTMRIVYYVDRNDHRVSRSKAHAKFIQELCENDVIWQGKEKL